MNILIFGANGMVGSAVLTVLSEVEDWKVYGTVRDGGLRKYFPPKISERIISGVDLGNPDEIVKVISEVRPDVVVNCVALTKHREEGGIHMATLTLNSLLPHRLAEVCKLSGARLIHISTDCVFSGDKGGYTEEDIPDASDLYGRSKLLGEVDYEHSITLRTSVIGHEFNTKYGLLEWFLSQEKECRGFRQAVFSGLPTVVFAQVIRDFVIPNPDLSGLYHLSASPIDKFSLLKLIAEVYEKRIEITPDDHLKIDRSLNSCRFSSKTGFKAPDWPSLIRTMRNQFSQNV